MTPEQITLVQTSFAKVAPIAEAAGNLFYGRMLEMDPSMRQMFKIEITEQSRKLMQVLALAVASLNRLDELKPALQRLGEKHYLYGVAAVHYETGGAALLWTLEQGLGDAFTPETRAAWAAAYTFMTTTMLEAAEQAAVEMAA